MKWNKIKWVSRICVHFLQYELGQFNVGKLLHFLQWFRMTFMFVVNNLCFFHGRTQKEFTKSNIHWPFIEKFSRRIKINCHPFYTHCMIFQKILFVPTTVLHFHWEKHFSKFLALIHTWSYFKYGIKVITQKIADKLKNSIPTFPSGSDKRFFLYTILVHTKSSV